MVTSWEPYQESLGAQEWNRLLLQARDYTVFQSYGWGEYKRLSGWQPLRYVAYAKDGDVVGMVQMLLKHLPLGFGIAWSPGGPVSLFGSVAVAPGDLAGLLADLQARYPRVLIRFQSHISYDAASAYAFSKTCKRSLVRLTSGFTLHMDLSDCEGRLTKRANAKHRYYMKKAAGAQIEWRIGRGDNDISTLLAIHEEMVASKKIPAIAISLSEITRLCGALGEDGVTVVTGYLDNAPVTSCMTLNFGAKSIYMVAATGMRGRKVCAAYAMIDELVRLLHQNGVKHFDFGGIDPASASAKGVDHFKRGFGGTLVEYLGEWESVRSEWVRAAMNLAILKRGRRI